MHRFITKKWIEVYDQSGNADNRYKPSKQVRFKISMLQSDLSVYSDAFVEGAITVTKPDNDAYDKKLAFKIMDHLLVRFQKLIMRLLIIQKI